MAEYWPDAVFAWFEFECDLNVFACDEQINFYPRTHLENDKLKNQSNCLEIFSTTASF